MDNPHRKGQAQKGTLCVSACSSWHVILEQSLLILIIISFRTGSIYPVKAAILDLFSLKTCPPYCHFNLKGSNIALSLEEQEIRYSERRDLELQKS